MFSEDDLLPLSALQHLLFCPRQCALIHLERLWAENAYTLEGRHLHEKADSGRAERRGTRRTGRGLLLRSFRLGLFGKADVVEFLPRDAGASAVPVADLGLATGATPTPPAAKSVAPPRGHSLPAGLIPFPVEYKRGKPKAHRADEVQLCAQALCLEEMLGVPVPRGALFYGKTRRRTEVSLDPALRALTEDTAARLHALLVSGQTPPAVREPKCEHCSLRTLCLPEIAAARSAQRYFQRALAGAFSGPPLGD